MFNYFFALALLFLFIAVFLFLMEYKKLTDYWRRVLGLLLLISIIFFCIIFALIIFSSLATIQVAINLSTL